jgi:Ribonuclease P 40kDa (Rpp40) subunit
MLALMHASPTAVASTLRCCIVEYVCTPTVVTMHLAQGVSPRKRLQEVELPVGITNKQCTSVTPAVYTVTVTDLPLFEGLQPRSGQKRQQQVTGAYAPHAADTAETDAMCTKVRSTGASCVQHEGAAASSRPADRVVNDTPTLADGGNAAPRKADCSATTHVEAGHGASSLQMKALQASAVRAERYLGALCCGFSQPTSAAAHAAATVQVERWQGVLSPCHTRSALERCRAAVEEQGAPWAALVARGVPHNPTAWQGGGSDAKLHEVNLGGVGLDLSEWPEGGENGAVIVILPGSHVCCIAQSGAGDRFSTL